MSKLELAVDFILDRLTPQTTSDEWEQALYWICAKIDNDQEIDSQNALTKTLWHMLWLRTPEKNNKQIMERYPSRINILYKSWPRESLFSIPCNQENPSLETIRYLLDTISEPWDPSEHVGLTRVSLPLFKAIVNHPTSSIRTGSFFRRIMFLSRGQDNYWERIELAMTNAAEFSFDPVKDLIVHKFLAHFLPCFSRNDMGKVRYTLEAFKSRFPQQFQMRDAYGNLPIHVGLGVLNFVDKGELERAVVEFLLAEFPKSVSMPDYSERLYPFQLAALGTGASVDCIYKLLQQAPMILLTALTDEATAFVDDADYREQCLGDMKLAQLARQQKRQYDELARDVSRLHEKYAIKRAKASCDGKSPT